MEITIRAGGAKQENINTMRDSSGRQNKNPKTVNAKDLHVGPNAGSVIDAKRGLAGKQAMKLVGDAWKRDQKASQSISDMINEKKGKVVELNELKRKMSEIDSLKSKYMEEYGIDPDSQEQKDLELLEKYQDNKYGAFSDKFSEEEIERLKELQNKPLTEYQEKVLGANYAKDALSIEYERMENEIKGLTQSIDNAKVEREKSQDMIKARDAAEQILDASGQEIMGMLFEEGKEHIDEEAEKEEEKAEKIADEKEEKEERLEKQKEQRKEQEEILHAGEDAAELKMDVQAEKMTDSQVQEAQKSIQKILTENHLINEDIKGIEIDLRF